MMFKKSILVTAAAVLVSMSASTAFADVKGCCQKGTPGVCGAPITVLGKKTCTVGWYKVTCSSKWNNCKKKDWMLAGPALKAR
jgi:hypothetical protein